jgi:hypothetical protein
MHGHNHRPRYDLAWAGDVTECAKPVYGVLSPGSQPRMRPLRPLMANAESTAWTSTGLIDLSTVFSGEIVGIREVEEQIWLVSFLDYDLGFFDKGTDWVEPAPNPFTTQNAGDILTAPTMLPITRWFITARNVGSMSTGKK